jgi:hypothetical protein
VDESTSNEGSATTDGNALPNRDPLDNAFQVGDCQAPPGSSLSEALGPAMPNGSGQRPHSAPSDQHRLPLAGKQRDDGAHRDRP